MSKLALPYRAALAAAVASAAFIVATPASATAVITGVGADYSTSPYTFSIGDSSFTFSNTGDIFGPTAVATGGTGMVNTIFGSPTTNFTNRGAVSFGPNDQYGAFASATPIRFSNGNNFIGLSATSGGQTIYGFAFTSNNKLNGFGFEDTAGAAISATSSVPEPATWALMIGGFGLVGGTMRRRATVRVGYAA